MNNTIQVLEQMGQDAALQSVEAQIEFVEQSDLSGELQTSLIEQDGYNLENQLGVRKDIVCAIMPAEDDEPEETPEEEPQDETSFTDNIVNG